MKMIRIKLLPLVLLTILGSTASAQCPFTYTFFGSGTAPTPGNSATLQTCSFIGEATTATGVTAGNSYCVAITYSGFPAINTFIVVYDASFNPVASGFSPITFTAPTSGTFYTVPFADAACTSFDPNFGCNSTLWANTTSNSTQTASACVEYTWPVNNQVYTASGIYTDSVLTQCGYLSVNLDLTINPNVLDYTVTNSNGTLVSNQNVGTYQWYDCLADVLMVGETNQSFTPSQAGSYAVIISDGNCIDTTSCFSVSINSTDTVVSCGPYTWPFNNQTYSSTGTYLDSASTPVGYNYGLLDLTIPVFTSANLAVANNNGTLTSQFSQPAAGYQWIDCSQNTPVVGATSQSFTPSQTGSYAVIISDGNCSDTSNCSDVFVPIFDSAAVCDDYTWTFNNQTYTSSGMYVDSVPLLGGYQVATLNLSIGLDPSNLQVTDSSGTLYSQSTLGNYQWIDCATNLPISGATNQSFSPTQTGSYAVIVSDGVCEDTSACTFVQVGGLPFTSTLNLSITPNPTDSYVTLKYEGEPIYLAVTDAKGRLIYSDEVESGGQVDLSPFEAGVYFFNIKASSGGETHRVVLR
jgi:hypothetical protein